MTDQAVEPQAAEPQAVEPQPAAPEPAAPPAPEGRDNPRREIWIGGLIALSFFGLFLGWAAFAPLDAGAYATGRIVVSGNRQAVQHRDGGTVSALHVAEGALVREGQVLVEISAGELRATERGLAGQVVSLLAQRSRLVAERDGLSTVPRPPEFDDLSPEDQALAEEALRLQQLQFSARGTSRLTQLGVLRQRISQLQQQIQGYESQIAANAEQARLIEEELVGLRRLAADGNYPLNRLRERERLAASLQGDAGQLAADVARAREAIGETRMQMLTLDTDTAEEVADRLREIEVQLNELQPRWVSAREQLNRALVRAPASGQVVGLSVFTVGGVVTPGQVIAEIVPREAALIIEAEVAPQDADDLNVGQTTQVRFTALQERSLPILTGEVTGISADSFLEESSGRRYFRVTVAVPPEEMARIVAVRGEDTGLRPGLPVEVVVPLRRRTALDYLLEPLTQTVWRSFREA